MQSPLRRSHTVEVPLPAEAGGESRVAAASRTSEHQLRTWMREGLAGNQRSQLALLRALRPILLSFFARRMANDKTEADDLVQEVLIVVHERRHTYQPDRPFTPWLFAIARYKLMDYLRQRGRCSELEFPDELIGAGDFAADADARMDLGKLLALLPGKQARAIRHTRLNGASVADAARIEGIGESDLKVSAHRGLKALSALVLKLA